MKLLNTKQQIMELIYLTCGDEDDVRHKMEQDPIFNAVVGMFLNIITNTEKRIEKAQKINWKQRYG